MANESQSLNALVAIKLLHTTVWAVMAGCILALPITGLLHHFRGAIITKSAPKIALLWSTK